jgi:hypothetical protein
MSRLYCAFLAFFEDAKSNKILSLPTTTSLEDNNAMFEELHNVNDGFAKVVKWEFEVEDEWLPFYGPSSSIFQNENDLVYLGYMASWMENREVMPKLL